ncbi:hypothetical protein B0J13DRAFT_563575 [Dactylonectria estremocensis]|uniref:Ankyrin n=1 Tax=Dactylonectria estremocensis TaxID=1079267 RepID=A0A9P9E0W7_9HYPO|nr:hypothetical protein B0J13DRAFT_563575 [Dactylonectria estremocensis]
MSSQTLPPPPTYPPPPDSSSLPVPAYSVTDDDSLFARIEQVATLNLPILHAPAPGLQSNFSWRLDMGQACGDEYEACCVENDIVNSFFASIEAGRDDVVADFVSRGLVSPDVTSQHGETPLLAAVRVGKTPMVSRLVALGATVNAFGVSKIANDTGAGQSSYPHRTPLQLAAETGHLALVKVLMEDYGADDGLVAPDGAIALRLAAMNGHRDVVQYLPARRGGAWLRWKTAHQEEMKRVRRALDRIVRFLQVFVWDIPKFLVYTIPKEVGKSVWESRHKVAKWCKRCKDKIVELPSRAKRFALALPGKAKNGAKRAWEGIKGIPPALGNLMKSVWKFLKEIPRVLKECAKGLWELMKHIPPLLKLFAVAIWNVVKAIPGVIKTFFMWIGRGLKSVGEAILNVLTRFLSLLHTALSAVLSFFRSITLKDIWDGFCSLLGAIFIDTPRAILGFFKAFGQMTYDVLKGLFGSLGKLIWYIAAGILWLVNYIPHKLWQCLEAMGRSIRRAFQEVMAYLDPKRM